jgi:sRNA-binding carbon storage regulator CsrA
MLILTRKPGQRIRIVPDPNLDPQTPIAQLFRDGPIEVTIGGIHQRQVKLGIQADARLLILRDELGAPLARLETKDVGDTP